jgi:hypothetical protein
MFQVMTVNMDPNIFVRNVQFLGTQGNKGAIEIDYIQRIINNNRTNTTEEERRNPVIFDKPCKNFIELEISTVSGKDSAKWLSGGNFEFKTNSGSGYILQLRYPEYDEPVKEAISIIRGSGFACHPGKKSTTCFLARKDPDDEGQARLLREICETVSTKMPLSTEP